MDNGNHTQPDVVADAVISGKKQGNLGLIFGIISIITSATAVIGILFAILGLVKASQSKNYGYVGGEKTGAFVCSIIGLILSVISIAVFVLIIVGVVQLF